MSGAYITVDAVIRSRAGSLKRCRIDMDRLSMIELHALQEAVRDEIASRESFARYQIDSLLEGFQGWSVSNERNAEHHGLAYEDDPEDPRFGPSKGGVM